MNLEEDLIIEKLDLSKMKSVFDDLNANIKEVERQMVCKESKRLQDEIDHHQQIINRLRAEQDKLLKSGIGKRVW